MGVGVTLLSLACAGAAFAVAEAEPEEAMGEEMAAEAPVAEAEPAAAPATGSPAVKGKVARAAFTTGVVDREPRDSVTALSNDQREVAYFTELSGLEGHTVVHRWEYGDQVMAEVPFEVRGPRWRIYSTKRLDPSWVGTWHVSVVVDGQVLARDELEYTPASAGTAKVDETPAAEGTAAALETPASEAEPADAATPEPTPASPAPE
jgi:hypothetical protein